jgi:glucan phosphorylase
MTEQLSLKMARARYKSKRAALKAIYELMQKSGGIPEPYLKEFDRFRNEALQAADSLYMASSQPHCKFLEHQRRFFKKLEEKSAWGAKQVKEIYGECIIEMLEEAL